MTDQPSRIAALRPTVKATDTVPDGSTAIETHQAAPGPAMRRAEKEWAKAASQLERATPGTRTVTFAGKSHLVATGNRRATPAERQLLGRPGVFAHTSVDGRVVCGPPSDSPADVLSPIDRRPALVRFLNDTFVHYAMTAVFGFRVAGPSDSKLTKWLRMLGIKGPSQEGLISRAEMASLNAQRPRDQFSIAVDGSTEHAGHMSLRLTHAPSDIRTSRGKLIARRGESFDLAALANQVSGKNLWQTLGFGLARVALRVANRFQQVFRPGATPFKFAQTGVEPADYVNWSQTNGFQRRTFASFKLRVLDETLNHDSKAVRRVGRALNDAVTRACISKIGLTYGTDLSFDESSYHCSELAHTAFEALRSEVAKHRDVLVANGAEGLLHRFEELALDTEPLNIAGGLLKVHSLTPDTVVLHPEWELVSANQAGFDSVVGSLRKYVSFVAERRDTQSVDAVA